MTKWPEAKMHVLSARELHAEFKGKIDGGQYTLTMWIVHAAYLHRPNVYCAESHHSTYPNGKAGVARRNVSHLCSASVYRASVGQDIKGTVYTNPKTYTVLMSKLNFYIVIEICWGLSLSRRVICLTCGLHIKKQSEAEFESNSRGLLFSLGKKAKPGKSKITIL